MKRQTALIIVAVALLFACGKPGPAPSIAQTAAPRPPYDFTKMEAKLKVGMTKAEVIAAIGAPTTDTETDPEYSKLIKKPGYFILSYSDGPEKIYFVHFQEGRFVSFVDVSPPPGLVPPP